MITDFTACDFDANGFSPLFLWMSNNRFGGNVLAIECLSFGCGSSFAYIPFVALICYGNLLKLDMRNGIIWRWVVCICTTCNKHQYRIKWAFLFVLCAQRENALPLRAMPATTSAKISSQFRNTNMINSDSPPTTSKFLLRLNGLQCETINIYLFGTTIQRQPTTTYIVRIFRQNHE